MRLTAAHGCGCGDAVVWLVGLPVLCLSRLLLASTQHVAACVAVVVTVLISITCADWVWHGVSALWCPQALFTYLNDAGDETSKMTYQVRCLQQHWRWPLPVLCLTIAVWFTGTFPFRTWKLEPETWRRTCWATKVLGASRMTCFQRARCNTICRTDTCLALCMCVCVFSAWEGTVLGCNVVTW